MDDAVPKKKPCERSTGGMVACKHLHHDFIAVAVNSGHDLRASPRSRCSLLGLECEIRVLVGYFSLSKDDRDELKDYLLTGVNLKLKNFPAEKTILCFGSIDLTFF